MYYSEDTEKYILSCIIQDDLLDISTIELNDFYYPENQEVYKSILAIKQKGLKLDYIALKDNLNISVDEIVKLMEYAPTTANYEHYLKMLHNYKYKRLIKQNSQKLDKILLENDNDPLQEVQNLFLGIEQKESKQLVSAKDATYKCVKEFVERSNNKGIPYFETYLKRVDEILLGIKNEDLVIVAARPAMGKTAFVLEIAKNNALKNNKRSLIFTLEMSIERCNDRMILSEALVHGSVYKAGKCDADEKKRIRSASETIASIGDKIYYCDETDLTITQIENFAKNIKKKFGSLDVIIIDYLQLMKGEGNNYQSKNLEVGEITRRLKLLAKKIKVPIILLSQLSRGPEMRADHRPILADLRDSGSIEQDADIVMFLYRDEYYNPKPDNKNIAEVIIAKNRDGACGTAKVKYIGEYTKFDNLIGG